MKLTVWARNSNTSVRDSWGILSDSFSRSRSFDVNDCGFRRIGAWLGTFDIIEDENGFVNTESGVYIFVREISTETVGTRSVARFTGARSLFKTR